MLGCFLATVLIGCGSSLKLDKTALEDAAKRHDVRILRDTWGVPHIFGDTDADTAFGLAYAHAEDDFPTIQESLLMGRGLLASEKGKEMAPIDFAVRLFRVWEKLDAQYEKDLSPDTRQLCEAYAEGVNYFAMLHPKEVQRKDVFPMTGKDVVAGFVLKAPLFFGLDGLIKKVMSDTPQPSAKGKMAGAASAARDFFLRGAQELGSNTFAVAPSRSADGKTRLNINSHQPWTGPVAWYEAHLHSNEGLDMVGGVFPGAPVILHGHNRNLGWAHTVNLPDLADVYELEMNPDNPNQYKFDGQWRDLERGQARISVRLWGAINWTVKRELLWSVHGPAVRTKQGVYAIRYAGMDNIRQVEQWYRMGKAQNFDTWLDAVRKRDLASFNIGYADREGNIYYLYNALLPKRAEGYDWQGYLPGNTSETLWSEYLPFEQLPQVKNPAAGFIQNCNNTPFQTTVGPENPRPENYSPTLGIDTIMTNRAHRALELFTADTSITAEEFLQYKFDTAYSRNGTVNELLTQLFAAPVPDDPLVREALDLLKRWDFQTNLENRSTAIAVLTLEPVIRAQMFHQEPPDLMATLREKARLLKDKHGRIDVEWGAINRMKRGDRVDIPLCGGPDCLHAVYGELKDGRLIGNAGDCYVLCVEWDKEGRVSSKSLHQFGSATMDERSPHFADQTELFRGLRMKDVWMDEDDIRRHMEKEYRPGEEDNTKLLRAAR